MRCSSGVLQLTRVEFTASLLSLGKVAWVRLDNDQVRFTVMPEKGTQVWAVLAIDSIFDPYFIQSASENNTINIELPLQALHRALKSALQAHSASIRLTKKDNIPYLSLTIVSSFSSSGSSAGGLGTTTGNNQEESVLDDTDFGANGAFGPRDREATITQEIPIRVLPLTAVEGIHEPRCREPDVHIMLPDLGQLKNISERFTKIGLTTKTGSASSNASGPKLELSANMHGSLRLGIATDALRISSVWTGLANPELNPDQVEGGVDGVREHPSTKMKALGGTEVDSEEGWAKVRIDAKDWSRVLSVGRLGGKVIACMILFMLSSFTLFDPVCYSLRILLTWGPMVHRLHSRHCIGSVRLPA
jgi:HUS1 checkpoint protein